MDPLPKTLRHLAALPFLAVGVALIGVTLAIAAAVAVCCATLITCGLLVFVVGRSINSKRMPSLREWFEDAIR